MTLPRSLCVYCGASAAVALKYKDAAYRLGQILATAGIEIVYGGGRDGLMGRLADGGIACGGRVVGILPRHLHEREIRHPGIAELILVDSMHERKRIMADRSDGFIVLPGGFGTLDEMFEIVTWRQLGLHAKPILIVDIEEYWADLKALIQRIYHEGFSALDDNLFTWVNGIDAILPTIEPLLSRSPTMPIRGV